MSYRMQLRSRTTSTSNKTILQEQKNKTNKLLTSLRELFGTINGGEVYEQAIKQGIKQVEEIEQKGYEIACVNQKLVLKKKESEDDKKKDEEGQKSQEIDRMSVSEFEKRYANSIHQYKEQIYYDLFIDNAKQATNVNTQQVTNKKKKKRRTRKQAQNQPKKNSISLTQDVDIIDNLSCFASSDHTSPAKSQLYLKTMKMNNYFNNQSPQTPKIQSLDNLDNTQREISNLYSEEYKQSEEESSGTQYLSDRKEMSDQKEIYDQKQSSPDYKSKSNKKFSSSSWKQISDEKQSSSSWKQMQDISKKKVKKIKQFDSVKINPTKRGKYKLKTSSTSSLSNQCTASFPHSKQNETKHIMRHFKKLSLNNKSKQDSSLLFSCSEDSLDCNDDLLIVNIFEEYDDLFNHLQEDLQEKKQNLLQSEIIPITHTPIAINQTIKKTCFQVADSPILKLTGRNNQLPKKLKSKVTRKYPQIKHLLQKDNSLQKARIQFSHPLTIFNAPTWFEYKQ